MQVNGEKIENPVQEPAVQRTFAQKFTDFATSPKFLKVRTALNVVAIASAATVLQGLMSGFFSITSVALIVLASTAVLVLLLNITLMIISSLPSVKKPYAEKRLEIAKQKFRPAFLKIGELQNTYSIEENKLKKFMLSFKFSFSLFQLMAISTTLTRLSKKLGLDCDQVQAEALGWKK